MNWEVIPLDEQELVMNIDYYEKTINIYTTRKSVAQRLKRKIGEPTKTLTNDGYIYGVEYKRNLFDKDVAKFFSKCLLVGTYRNDNDDEEIEETEELETKSIE